MQGSSTGGKDRPLDSIWEKAINGAQKLFGLDSSKPTTPDETSETDDHAEERAPKGNSAVFDTVPGFGSRGFGRFGASAFGGNTFGSVATSRSVPDSQTSHYDQSSASFTEKAEYVAKERAPVEANPRENQTVAKEKIVSEDPLDEEKTVEEKPVSKPAARAAQKGVATQAQVPVPVSAITSAESITAAAQPATPIVPTASSQQLSSETESSKPLTGNSQSIQTVPPVASSDQKVNTTVANGSEATKQSNVPTQGGANAATNPNVQPAAQATNVKGAAHANGSQADKTNAGQANQVAVPNQSIAKSDTPVATTQSGIQSKAEGETAVRENGSSKETLGFDVAKAKEAVSEGLARASTASKPAASPVNQSSVNPSPVQQSMTAENREGVAKPLAGEASTARTSEMPGGEAKDLSSGEVAKREPITSAQSRAAAVKTATADSSAIARANSAGLENASSDAKGASNQVSNSAAATQSARESASGVAARIQTPVTQGKGQNTGQATGTQTGLSGVTAGQGLASNAMARGAQQGGAQNQDSGDPASSKDFSAALKQTTGAKGAEKPSADGAQSFDAKVDAATSNRRSEAASKARQTSYVSKTADEVKEVVATLTKSIDRLVTNKAGAMNLKINFEGGGSLSLRVSMDGGQVSTSMQTDVVGLEGAIKANWTELASDWNQKGVKLNTPQFQNSETAKGSFDDLNEFASKQDRQADARNGEGRGQSSNGRSATSRGFSNGSPDGVEAETVSSNSSDEVVSDKELKTYA